MGFYLVVCECPGTHSHNHTRFPFFTKVKWVGPIHHVLSAHTMLHSGAGIWASGSRWGVCHLGQEPCRQVTPGVLPQPITWAQLRPPPCRQESTICQRCDMTHISGLGPRNPDEREVRAIYSCRRLPIALGADRITVHRGPFSIGKLKWWAQISHPPPHFPDTPEPCLINQISLTGPCRPHRAPWDCPLTSLCSYRPAASCVLPRLLLLQSTDTWLVHCPRSSFPNRHKPLGSLLGHRSLWRAFLDRDPNVSPPACTQLVWWISVSLPRRPAPWEMGLSQHRWKHCGHTVGSPQVSYDVLINTSSLPRAFPGGSGSQPGHCLLSLESILCLLSSSGSLGSEEHRLPLLASTMITIARARTHTHSPLMDTVSVKYIDALNVVVAEPWLVHVLGSDSLRPMDCSPPGSCAHGILQAGILEWAAILLQGTFLTQGLYSCSLRHLHWHTSSLPAEPSRKPMAEP